MKWYVLVEKGLGGDLHCEEKLEGCIEVGLLFQSHADAFMYNDNNELNMKIRCVSLNFEKNKTYKKIKMTARAQQFEKWLKDNCKYYIRGQAEKIISERICPGDLFELRATETKSGTPKTFQF